MSGAILFDDGHLDFNTLREITGNTFLSFIDEMVRPILLKLIIYLISHQLKGKGSKALVIDPSLTSPLNLIVEVQSLKVFICSFVFLIKFHKEHGISKFYTLNSNQLDTDCNDIIYLIRPELSLVKFIAQQVNNHKNIQAATPKDPKQPAQVPPTKRNYMLCFVPRKSLACEKILEEDGIHGRIIFF